MPHFNLAAKINLMNELKKTGWTNKFKNAFAGIAKGIAGENSFYVHLPVAMLVVGLAFFLKLNKIEFLILLLCIGIVLAAELFNSSIERMAKSITSEFDENIGQALDIASGAVLVVSITAAIIGAWIIFPAVLEVLMPHAK